MMSRSLDTSAVLHTNFIGSVTTVEILCLAMEFYILISLHAFIWNNTINKFTRLPLSEDNTYLMEYINENDIVHRDMNTDSHQQIEEPEGHRGSESDRLVTSGSFIESSVASGTVIGHIGTSIHMVPEIRRRNSISSKFEVYSFVIFAS